jgi:hypothetical protein
MLYRKQNTYFTFDNFFFFKSRAIYEIMWRNTVRPARPKMTIWRKRFPCWITKDKDKHSEYVIPIAFLWPQWFRERASMFRLYVHCLSCCCVSMILFHSLHSLLLHGFIALVYYYYRWCTGGYVWMDRPHSSEQRNLTVGLEQFRPN